MHPVYTHPNCILCIHISFLPVDATKVYVDLGRRCKFLGLAHQGLILDFSVGEKSKI
jgi:hypothetical protein